MSNSLLPLEIGQLEIWIGLLIERIQLKPAESIVVATSVAFAGFILKRLIAAPFYRNIDGPANVSFLYGM